MSFIDPDYFFIATHLLAAIAAGGIIGLERSYHGHPAGFRTHTLVCLSSSLLMLVMLYQSKWMPDGFIATTQTDPTRMAQGIMTGIGFLGAGVIYKHEFSVRGLTTAASIWVTAAIGILIGIGFYFPAIFSTAMALGTLSVFRRIERWLPNQNFAQYWVSFDRADAMPEDKMRTLLAQHGFAVASISYHLKNDAQLFEYQMTIRTTAPDNLARLAETTRDHPLVREFRIGPAIG